MSTRTLRCTLSAGGTLPAELPLEPRDLTPWIDRWTFERGGKRWRVAVLVLGPEQQQPLPWTVPSGWRIRALGWGQPTPGDQQRASLSVQGSGLAAPTVRYRRELETIDPREWIESLGDAERWPEGTEFEVVIEEVPTP